MPLRTTSAGLSVLVEHEQPPGHKSAEGYSEDKGPGSRTLVPELWSSKTRQKVPPMGALVVTQADQK